MFLATHGILRSGGVIPYANNYSIELDGISDYVTMGNTLDFTNTDAFSISCWFKRTRSGVSEFLVAKQDSTSNSRGYSLLIPSSDNKVTVVIRNNIASSGRLIVDCTTAITDTNWHHIVMTYDGSSNVSGVNLYLDGNNDTGVTSGTLSSNISNNASFEIGARNALNQFSGKIDEVSVFNSELSASDVTSIYNSGVPNDISSLSPLSWWRCGDGDTSPTLTDNGSGGNDGTMVSFTTFSTDVPLFDNKSFEYDGVNDYLDCGNDSSLNFSADDSFSFSVWFKKGSDSGSNTVFSKGLGAINYDGYYMFVLADYVYFRIRHNNSNFHEIKDNDTHPLNTWVHYLVTYDGSRSALGGGLNLYKDGTLLTNVSRSGNFSSGSGQTIANFGIGARIIDSAAHFNGKIDEVSVFNSELSQSDVTSIYNGGVSSDLNLLSTTPISWWREESGSWDGSKWTITDSGSEGNDAESISMTLESRSSDVPT